MNKIVLAILLFTTSPLFSMHTVRSRLVSRASTPNRSISFQKRAISTVKAQKILNPVSKMSLENKLALQSELDSKHSTLRYLECQKKLWDYNQLTEWLRYRSEPPITKEQKQLAQKRDEIFEELYEQIAHECKHEQFDCPCRDQKNNSMSVKDAISMCIALKCFQETRSVLKEILFNDQEYSNFYLHKACSL